MNALTLMLSSMLLTQCALDADTVRFAYKHWMLWMLMLCALALDNLRIDVDAECTDVNFAFIGCWRFVYCLKMLCTLILMLFAIAAVTACIGCWLMPPALIFDWFISWVLNRSGSIHAVYSGIFLWTGFFFHSHPTLMSFCTKGLTGVAESTVSKSDKTFSLGGERTLKTIIPHTLREHTF